MTVVADLRTEAAERFAQLGWPTPRIEEWRYTNLAPVQKIAWRVDDAPAAVDLPFTYAARAVTELVFVNGRLVRGENVYESGGVASALHIADWERNALVALNFANEQDGARIVIPDGTVVEGFIHLLFVGKGDGIWSHPRNTIVVGKNAQVTIVESYVGSGNYFTNSVTEIVAGENAVVDHYKLQCESRDAFHVGNIFIRQERASNVTSRSIAIGAQLARTETYVALAGEGASIVLDGLFTGTGTQHLDNRTVIDHIKPHCESLELYKGILDQNARGVFDGRIIVRPDAQKTVSRQVNRNLLLSETAVVDSKPTLEIHNDDVKCNHGSTIGQIEAEPLFYLRSRGIGEEEARNLLVYAFASELVDRMKIEPVREQIRRALFQSLPQRLPERRVAAQRGEAR
ncbi:MAG TPA: Fe-S cluster assembly protein SufD [Thermoanaerobaculia bacterium]